MFNTHAPKSAFAFIPTFLLFAIAELVSRCIGHTRPLGPWLPRGGGGGGLCQVEGVVPHARQGQAHSRHGAGGEVPGGERDRSEELLMRRSTYIYIYVRTHTQMHVPISTPHHTTPPYLSSDSATCSIMSTLLSDPLLVDSLTTVPCDENSRKWSQTMRESISSECVTKMYSHQVQGASPPPPIPPLSPQDFVSFFAEICFPPAPRSSTGLPPSPPPREGPPRRPGPPSGSTSRHLAGTRDRQSCCRATTCSLH